MECQYGPRRKGAVNKKQTDYNEHSSPVKKHRPTCPARIYIKKVRKFPEFRIDPTLDAKHVRQAQERALTALRLAGVDIGGEERYYQLKILIFSLRLLDAILLSVITQTKCTKSIRKLCGISRRSN